MPRKKTIKNKPITKPTKKVKKAPVKRKGLGRDEINQKRDRYFMLATVLLILIISVFGYLVFDYLITYVFSANEIDPVAVEAVKVKIDINKFRDVVTELNKLRYFAK